MKPPFYLQPFNPPGLIRSAHAQSVLASSKIRLPWIKRRSSELANSSQAVILTGDDGVKLNGFYTEHEASSPLAVLIHGWEGSGNSQYILSCAANLLANGYSVFRLQLRDHGDSHHLNPEVFHSCRLAETAEAVRQISLKYKPTALYLGGFSLGGNFSLRIANIAPSIGLSLDAVCAISPVIDPAPTLRTMENGPWIYREYFMKKWRRSLRKKTEFFPDAIDVSVFKTHRTLVSLTEVLVKTVGGFGSVEEYFDGYSVRDDRLHSLQFPTVILAAQDDPIVPDEPLTKIAETEFLTIQRRPFGGHCGFINNFHTESYADHFMLSWFNEHRTGIRGSG